MQITYNDAVENITTFIKSRDLEKHLIIELTSELNIPSAMKSVQMLDNTKNLLMKIDFVYSMLKGNGVLLKYKEETLCSFQVTEGMTFDNVEFFAKHPAIYRYFIDAIFGVFLKNSYPLLSESQEAE